MIDCIDWYSLYNNFVLIEINSIMPRGRGYSSTPRGYRGNSHRGNSSWNGSSSRGSRGGYPSSSKYNSFHSSMESRSPYEPKSKYSSSSDRFSRSDDYHKSYRSVSIFNLFISFQYFQIVDDWWICILSPKFE